MAAGPAVITEAMRASTSMGAAYGRKRVGMTMGAAYGVNKPAPRFPTLRGIIQRGWRNRSTAATSARRTPGSSAEWPASGIIDSRADGHAAASSKAERAGQIMS